MNNDWSAVEDATLRRLNSLGWSAGEMMRKLPGRTRHAIVCYMGREGIESTVGRATRGGAIPLRFAR